MSAIIIGACIAGNAHLRELKYACHLNLSVPQGSGTPLRLFTLFLCSHSVNDNAIEGDTAQELAKVVLAHL